MKNLKTKLVAGAIFLSPFIYAQTGSVKSKVNQIITDYLLPVFIIFILVAVIAGVVRNFDLIEDKNNEGTRVKGFTNVGMLALYVFIAELVIAGIVSVLGSINLTIK